jgi:hypothetical protein
MHFEADLVAFYCLGGDILDSDLKGLPKLLYTQAVDLDAHSL